MTWVRVLVCVALAVMVVAVTEETTEVLPTHKCLTCENSTDLMCYSNQLVPLN